MYITHHCGEKSVTGETMNQEPAKPSVASLRINRDEPHLMSQPGTKKSRTLLWIMAGGAILAMAGYLLFGAGKSTAEVQTATVQRLAPASAQSLLTATGYVVAQRAAAVASKGTGRLEDLRVEEGDQVKAGEIIARLEAADVNASLSAAKAALGQAEAGLEFARAQAREAKLRYDRVMELRGKKLASDAEHDQALAAHESAVANVSSAEAGLDAAKANVQWAEVQVENTIIRAPFDGTVLTKTADVGEVVAPFASSASSRGAVVTIADMASLEVEADVSESNIQQIHADQPCLITLDALPAEPYRGKVKKIVPTADRSKATVMVKVSFDQLDNRVLPEMSAKINFLPGDTETSSVNTETVLTVPTDAVISRNGVTQLFVIHQGRVSIRMVETGRTYGVVLEIKSGVNIGDIVVVSPPESLTDGDTVKLKS
jgi:RND family efflux transporter MFP subunit